MNDDSLAITIAVAGDVVALAIVFAGQWVIERDRKRAARRRGASS